MTKSILKALLCIILCLAMTVSLFSCSKKESVTSTADNIGSQEFGDPSQCTLCPDKNHCCFCYQYGNCVCDEEKGNDTGGNTAKSVRSSGDSVNKRTDSGSGKGSGKGNASSAAKFDPASLKGKTITILRSWGPYASGNNTAHDNWNERVAEVEKKYGVDIVEKKWSVKLEQEVLAGVKPSGQLYQVNGDWAANYAKSGYIGAWDDAMKATGIDMTSDAYFPHSVQLCNYNGKQYAIGVEEGKMMSQIVYNKNLTSEFADVEKLMDEGKWTWSAMTDIAKKVKAKYPGKWGIYIGYLLDFYGMVASNGSQLVSISKDGTLGSNLKDAKVQQAFQQIYDWIHVDKVALAFKTGDSWDFGLKELMKGNVAFTFNEDACYASLKEGMNGNEYGIAYLPKGPSANQYYTCIESSWPIVMPKAYEDRGPELLFIVDQLYSLKSGYTKDTQFRDLYIRNFTNSQSYNRVKNMHRTIKAAPIIEIELGSTQEWMSSVCQLLDGKTTVGAYIDTYHSSFDAYMKDNWKNFKFTGDLSK